MEGVEPATTAGVETVFKLNSFKIKASAKKISEHSQIAHPRPAIFENIDTDPDEMSMDCGDSTDAVNLIPQLHMESDELLFCREEGARLAELGELEPAICMWNRALRVTPNDHFLLEMKSQALLSIGSLVRAASVASQVTTLAPSWPYGHLTLARAQRELGEVSLGNESICIFLNVYSIST
jgi:predicted Zn-dependent protease